jgi:NAD(P)H-nitrite reductase large subunit
MIVCRCNEVSLLEINQFLKKYPTASLDELKSVTRAATSCGRCTAAVEKLFEKHQQKLKPDDQLRLSF